MKKLFATVLFFFTTITSYSQIVFEKGYYINESDKKTECYIKNVDWRNNPTEFEYKLSPDGAVQLAGIQNVKEFGVNNVSRYVRVKTKIDRSVDIRKTKSATEIPVLQEELLFLKLIIEGQASLYLYREVNLRRYYYKIKDSEIKPLIVDNYKHQILTDLPCEDIPFVDIHNLEYAKKDFKQLFIKYNECTSSPYLDYEPKQRKDIFHLSVRPGSNTRSLEVYNNLLETWNMHFDKNTGVRFGIEAEYILPFNKNKWGLIVEPAYQYFNSEEAREISTINGGVLISKVNYTSIELSTGIRHYFYLSNTSKIFTNISYVYDIPVNSSVEFIRKDGSSVTKLDIISKRNLALGIGYEFKGRYGLEVRYQTNRDLLGKYTHWHGNYHPLSLILQYSFF